MKPINAFFAACILCCTAFASFSQQASVVGQHYYTGADYGRFYLRAGVNLLSKEFVDHLNTKTIYGSFNVPNGWNFEMGRYYFLHEEPVAELLKVGLDATFLSFGYNPFRWEDSQSSVSYENADYTTAGLKLGPVVSVNPVGDLYVDAFWKLAPTILTSFSDLTEMDGVSFSWKNEIGINLRYHRFTVTAGYESGSFKNTVYLHGYGEDSFTETIPMGMLQVKAGIQFF